MKTQEFPNPDDPRYFPACESLSRQILVQFGQLGMPGIAALDVLTHALLNVVYATGMDPLAFLMAFRAQVVASFHLTDDNRLSELDKVLASAAERQVRSIGFNGPTALKS